MNRAELVSQRRQTRAWIEADPTELVISRVERTKTPDGGYTNAPVDLDPQQFKIFWASLGQQFLTPTGSGGRAVVIRDQVLGRWDADIKPGDKFEYAADVYEIEDVSDTPYRKIATLVERTKRG